MLIQDVMQTKIFTVTPETRLPEALRLTGVRGIRHLPVLDGDKLVGIVSDRDLKRAMPSPATSLEAHELSPGSPVRRGDHDADRHHHRGDVPH
jgi:acetoin utilization protein AcuB